MERAPQESVDGIISQYREITGALQHMFQVMSPRVKYELWKYVRPTDEYHMVGSCGNQDRESSEEELVGIARNTLIELRETRNAEASGESELTDCPYHRTEGGCVLGDLKGPYCIGHIDSPSELNERFGLSGYGMMRVIKENLAKILSAQTPEEIGNNRALVESFREQIEATTEHIETFPMLLPNPST
jgi:hypothetical protein